MASLESRGGSSKCPLSGGVWRTQSPTEGLGKSRALFFFFFPSDSRAISQVQQGYFFGGFLLMGMYTYGYVYTRCAHNILPRAFT